MCLELVKKHKITESVTMYLGYSGSIHSDWDRGSVHLLTPTDRASIIVPEVGKLYDRVKLPEFPLRRISISFNNVVDAEYRQLSLFSDVEEDEKELKAQQAALSIKNRFGSNAVLKGMNLEAGGTTIERNNQIGGHKK